MERLIKKLPIPIAGLMLALASAGNLLSSYGNVYKNIFGLISSIILMLLVIKIIASPKAILEDLKNPVIASVSPTFSMGIMILATYLKPYSYAISFGMWIIGLVLHCMLIIYFTCKYLLKFDIKKVFPSYFVVYVGIVAASLTAPAFNLYSLGKYIFWFGFISYILLLPVICYRVFVVKSIPEPALPTITIFAAPASLCLAGYMNSFQEKNMTMVIFLVSLALIMTISVLLYLPKMLKIKFYPSYSAFTFPLVISGVAMKLTNGFLIKANKPIGFLKYLVKFEEVLAVIIVLYVLIRYTQFLFSKDANKSEVKSNSKSLKA